MATTEDQVPDWIVGFYLSHHIVKAVQVVGEGNRAHFAEIYTLATSTPSEFHRKAFRQALGEFERSFKYRPSVTQARDALAQIVGLEQLNESLDGGQPTV